MKIFLIIYIISLIASYYYMRKDFIEDRDNFISLWLMITIIFVIIMPIFNTSMALVYFILSMNKYIIKIKGNYANNRNYINIIDKIFFVKRKPPF